MSVVEQYINSNVSSSKKTKIDSIKNQIIDITHSMENTIQISKKLFINSPEDIDSKKKYLEDIIESYKVCITNLTIKLDNITKNNLSYRTPILAMLYKHPVLQTSECSICFELKPRVDLHLPCTVIDQITGRPKCEINVCIICARQITGLSISRAIGHLTVCPICKKKSPRHYKAGDTYSINMPIMRVVDSFLIQENTIFMDHFGIQLKPITCFQCMYDFDTLSDLHHHLRGDKGYTSCPESTLFCPGCNDFTQRKFLINVGCVKCSN